MEIDLSGAYVEASYNLNIFFGVGLGAKNSNKRRGGAATDDAIRHVCVATNDRPTGPAT
jgi:hypothetical protein